MKGVAMFPWLVSLLIVGGVFGVQSQPLWAAYWGFGVALMLMFFVLYCIWRSPLQHQSRWILLGFLLPPVMLWGSFFLFFLFLEEGWMKMAALGCVVFFEYWLFKEIYLYLFKPLFYQPYALGYLFYYTHMIALFFLLYAGFSLMTFMKFPLWLLVWLLCVTSFFFLWQEVSSVVSLKYSWRYLFVISLMVGECVWILSWLPISAYSLAFSVLACVYVMFGLTRHQLSDTLKASQIQHHVFVASVLVLLILGTSRWS